MIREFLSVFMFVKTIIDALLESSTSILVEIHIASVVTNDIVNELVESQYIYTDWDLYLSVEYYWQSGCFSEV